MSTNSTTNPDMNFIFKIANIISSNEGSYGSINQYDGSASSIGILQWNGSRAKKLLQLIINKDEEQAKEILDGTNILDILNKDDEFWDNKILDSFSCIKVRNLLITNKGMEAQNELLTLDIGSYITHGEVLGISDKSALAFFADLENQVGYLKAEEIIKNIGPQKELTMLNILSTSILNSHSACQILRRKSTYIRIMSQNF